jgi:hypothetical protein
MYPCFATTKLKKSNPVIMCRNMEASYEEVCRALSETPVPDLEEVSAINFATFTNYTGNLCLVSRGGQANF